MKIALVHDYIKEYGGAERVLEALHEAFPDAPVFTTLYLPEYLGPHADRFKSWKIHTSFFQTIPMNAKLISPLRLLSPMAFRQFDFSHFDVIITSATGAYFPNALRKKDAKLLCYCHTPPRYLYGYATARDWKKHPMMNAIGEIANHFLRMVDKTASEQVNQYIANSEEVRRRIQKFYRRDAIVINPPVDVRSKHGVSTSKRGKEKTKYERQHTTYFLAGGRLARPKHMDLIVQVCTEMGLPLKVFGKAFAGYGDELKQVAGRTVEFLGEVSDAEKETLFAGAKAYLFASEDEDFGITPVEAMASGTPVIAYRSGGVLETVVEGKTGLFFDELTTASLKKAIDEFETKKFDPAVMKRHAEQFKKERFIKEIRALVDKTVKE